jgi:hypothetical protein
MTTHYLPLTDYSSKYGVSISTLRRKIKAEDIRFKFEDGKYLIYDQPVQTHQKVHRPSLTKSEDSFVLTAPSTERLRSGGAGSLIEPVFNAQERAAERINDRQEEPILSAANRLLTELKRAYSQILQEKEEQILNLKEEVIDLKTLTRVLESEIERLRSMHP